MLFVQEAPFNNMWLMVVLIWVQTGFAMVILSAAIKAVPTELTEAAKVDGATESQVFWRITLPQIAPTIGVVVTALFVTVMKVFDIVYAMTNGNFGTQVIANQMWISAFGQSNLGLGSALAVVLFVSVIPVMWINIRRTQRDGHEEGTMTAGIVNPDQRSKGAGGALYRFLRSIPTWVLWLLVVVWSIPTLGLLVNSFRTRDQQRSQWLVDRVARLGDLTLDNYRQVLGTTAAGGMKQGLTNSFAIALPATIIPIAFAAFAAYAFAWIDFKHRQGLFIGTVALLAVPLQVALIPLLLMYVNGAHWTIPCLDKTITVFPDLNLAGTTTVDLAHPHRVRDAVRDLPAAQLHLVAAEGHLRVGAHRRRQPLPHLLAPRAAAVGAGAGRVRHLPVPVDVERLPRRRHDDRRQRRRHRPRC